MIKADIQNLIEKSVKNLQKKNELPDFSNLDFFVEQQKNSNYGDYSSNVALQISKITKTKPGEIAEKIVSEIKSNFVEKTEVAGAGFINFFISKKYLQNKVEEILKQKDKYGSLENKKESINVEFISANPTGPLTLGNGRGGFCGDVLANILKKAGYKVAKEYYINDAGEQIRKLGHSVIGDSEAVYKGDYIEDLQKKIKDKDPEKAGQKAAEIILKDMIVPSVKRMGIEFDVWFSENNLHEKKEIEKAIIILKNKNLTYEKDGALWFKSTQFGDDKDRVLIKENGEKTYFASDVAYLINKFSRKFKKLILFVGADHYGYINRLKAAAEALGKSKEDVDVITMQLVRLFDNGKEVRMSKRAGIYITLDELIEEVGPDVTRFFFLTRAPETHLNFDLNLAKEQSKKNPVFYIQYAFARINSIIKKSDQKWQKANISLLEQKAELELIKQLIRFPEIIKEIKDDFQIQKITQYATELADSFHKFYENCQVITEDKDVSKARLALVFASKIVFKNVFDVLGIRALENM